MTRSKLIAMLQTSATSLNALASKAPASPSHPADPADSQVATSILQLILQILESILAEQQAPGQSSADLLLENKALTNALNDILTSMHIQNSKQSGDSADSASVQVNILQIIIQILQAILIQKNDSEEAHNTAASADASTEVSAIEPRLTADSITYTIDSLGRLTKATYASGYSVTYNYDAVGNRTSVVTVL